MYISIAEQKEYVFPDRLKMPFQFSAEKLANDLSVLNKTEWTEHFVKQNYEGDWSAIPLRSPIGETHPIRMIYSDPSATEFVETDISETMSLFSGSSYHILNAISALFA